MNFLIYSGICNQKAQDYQAVLYSDIDTIILSWGAFNFYIPAIKSISAANVTIVHQDNLLITSPFNLPNMPPQDTLLKWKDALQKENDGRQCVIQCQCGI